MNCEFDYTILSAIPRCGLTSIAAVEYARQQFPKQPNWTVFQPGNKNLEHVLAKLANTPGKTCGKISGGWTWTRLRSHYPTLSYRTCADGARDDPAPWVGFLRVKGPKGANFIIFSYLDSKGKIAEAYLISDIPAATLENFINAVADSFKPDPNKVVSVYVHNKSPIELPVQNGDPIFLNEGMLRDIEEQVFSFFTKGDLYKQLKLPHRRGFLFTGVPGTGKTMTLKHLIRECHKRFRASVFMLNITKDIDEFEFEQFFERISKFDPALVILEELDSLTNESRVSRASLLAQLDGIGTKDGFLILGTTNNPGDIDPALIHRPSRFDRVWHFELPDKAERLKYLEWAFPDLPVQMLHHIAEETEHWSFAYLHELKVTAAIQSLTRKSSKIQSSDLVEALAKLSTQFESGRKNHVDVARGRTVGFKAA